MTAIAIALGHGLAVILAWAVSGGSRGVAAIGAALSLTVAVLKGQLIFLPLDLVGIAIGWGLVIVLNSAKNAATTPAASEKANYSSPPRTVDVPQRLSTPTPRHWNSDAPLARAREIDLSPPGPARRWRRVAAAWLLAVVPIASLYAAYLWFR